MNSSSAPKSWTKPKRTSAIESPAATAMLRLCEGIVRRAFSEPSIGSITTRAAPPSRRRPRRAPRRSATKEAPSAAELVELGEDLVLAVAVDHQGVIAALADALVDRAFLAGHDLVEDAPLGGRRCGGRFPASLRRKRPSEPEPTAALALDDASDRLDRGGGRGAAARCRATPTAPLLVLGAAGTGKSELLARRLADLAAAGTAPERVLVIGARRGHRAAAARTLRGAARRPLRGALGRLAGTRSASGCCASTAEAAGLDPFFDVLGPAERLAVLLDRFDSLPLRRHEIRGNPAGLLARLLARIDA